MVTIDELLGMPKRERLVAIRQVMDSAANEEFEIFEAYELYDEEDYIKMEPKETYPVTLVVGKVEDVTPSIKDSFKELSENYGHYFEGVDPVEYVKEMRGYTEQTNGYVFTGEYCDQ